MAIVRQPLKKPLPPAPQGLELMPHQLEAIKFGLETTPCYLALDPGLGKTIVAATISRVSACFTVFVTPPSLIENVRDEFRRWHPKAGVELFGGRRTEYDTCDVLIIPDSILSPIIYYFLLGLVRLRKEKGQNSLLIIDEAHRFTNEKALRTAALLGRTKNRGIIKVFDRTIYMSGTPLSNRPMELFPILSRSAPECIDNMSYYDYGRRFCDGKKVQIRFGRNPKWAWDFTGESNLKELAARVIHPRGPFMLRLRKDRIKLPPKIEELFVFSRTMSPRLSSLDGKIGEAYEDVSDLIKEEISGKAGLKARELHIASYRRLLGIEKIKAAAEYIETILTETKESILVFALHKEVIEGLSIELMHQLPIIITGETKKELRQKLVKDFQAGKARLVLANYKAAGVGFTLTAATRVIFVEFSWNPADNEQAGDRAHRIGQTKTVYVQYMVYKDSVDKKVIESLLKKREGSRYI